MGDFYFSVNNAAASKEKSLFPPLRCAASSKGKASQWGERPVWEWSGGLRGGGGHPKMYSNTHHADPDLGNIIKYWNRTKNDPDALKKKKSFRCSPCPEGSPSFLPSAWNTLLLPIAWSAMIRTDQFSFTLFIICIFHPPQHYMVEETFYDHPSNSFMAPWTYHITALVTLFWNSLFSCPQIRC